MGFDLENINPKLYRKCQDREITPEDEDDNIVDEFDSREVFDLIRSINDPEHPLTLEELNVLKQDDITGQADTTGEQYYAEPWSSRTN